MIWFNSSICIENKPVYFKKWYKSGIVYVADIVNDDGTIKTIDQLQQQYCIKINFVNYHGIISAIPKYWRDWLTSPEEVTHQNDDRLQKCVKTTPTVKIIYSNLISEPYLIVKKLNKQINPKTGEEFEIKEFCNQIMRIPKYTICVKLRSFQYRLMMRAVVTNVQLYHYKIREDTMCSNCNKQPETIQHLFYECEKSSINLELRV